MRELASILGPGFFFVPFAYVVLYLYVERQFSQNRAFQNALKAFAVLIGLFMIIYAWSAPDDWLVLMPGLGGMKNHIPAAVFLVVVGVATMALPLYSKYISFSNKSES